MSFNLPAVPSLAPEAIPALSKHCAPMAGGLFCLWWLLLIIFYLFPQIDISVTHAFFTLVECPPQSATGQVCGHFPYQSHGILRFLRLVLFYLPGSTALFLILLLVRAIWLHGAGFWMTKARALALALMALVLGPYLLVNIVLKSLSGRPRPYETDLFAGHLPFAPAGSFSGACHDNCSFVSGEAAGAGWVACLIPLLPAWLRPILGPPIMVVSLVTPALRIAFGGHFLSDVTLGWLSSVVIFCLVFACAEITRRRIIARD